MSFINTKQPLKIGGHYQYKEGFTGFGDDAIVEVELIEDNSDKRDWKLRFKVLSEPPEWMELEKDSTFTSQMMKGNFYYSGMPRIWDEGEYSY